MQAAAQHFGLKTSLAVERDDPSFGHGTFHGPEFFDDADPVVGDVRKPASSQATNTRMTIPTIQNRPPGRSVRAANSGGEPGVSDVGNQRATCSTSGEPTANLLS